MSQQGTNKKPIRVESVPKCNFNFTKYLYNRTLGKPNKIGFNDNLNLKLFGSINHVEFEKNSTATTSRGGIFNLEFSLDGFVYIRIVCTVLQFCPILDVFLLQHVRKNRFFYSTLLIRN